VSALRKAEPATAKIIPIRPEPALAAAYRAAISVHFPNLDAFTMSLRVEIMGIRDRATLALNRCCPEAEPILGETARLATLAALANISARRLAYTRAALESMMNAAQMMQRAHA